MTRIRNPTLAAAATSACAGRAPPPRVTTSRCAAVEPEEASSTSASGSQPGHLERALQAAVRNEDDTDTVAAIAGALLGARYGIEAIPAVWRANDHGWPGLRADDLIDLAVRTAESGRR